MTRQFEIGQTYSCRSICDHECIFEFTVTKRTAKFVTLENRHGRIRRAGVRVSEYDNAEMCYPMGNYSMCPVITA